MSGQVRRFLFCDSDGSFTASPNYQTPTAGDGSLLSPFTPTESRYFVVGRVVATGKFYWRIHHFLGTFRQIGTRRKLSMSGSPFDALPMNIDENSPLCKSRSRDSGRSCVRA